MFKVFERCIVYIKGQHIYFFLIPGEAVYSQSRRWFIVEVSTDD
jgi:hypothetical protein